NGSLALEMQTAPSDIAYTKQRFPEHLLFDGEVPGPRLRILEVLALCGDYQGSLTGAGARPKSIDYAVGQAGVWLERRGATQEEGGADAQAREEAPQSRTPDRFG